ncbi:uncharacterized protein LOC119650721 isoform X1 [Hermetia illucens]|uniref:uncharacterized protein LOC119650721 isoform X1 n=1 Tax=Hermetia illucens TaxID=343691 RepID=UPI0018CC4E45|nr:uncharacterized protein LOC119650721 isoform X1 [Hermetia illucens]
MFIRIQEPALKTWKRVSHILNSLWSKLYQPLPAIEMPRTRRRHHSKSRSRSSGGYREKRRRIDSDESSRRSISRYVPQFHLFVVRSNCSKWRKIRLSTDYQMGKT